MINKLIVALPDQFLSSKKHGHQMKIKIIGSALPMNVNSCTTASTTPGGRYSPCLVGLHALQPLKLQSSHSNSSAHFTVKIK